MKIISIEPTPSPNTMKLNMDESLPDGVNMNFSQEGKEDAPPYIRKMLQIEGVKSIFQVMDFIAVERYAKTDWREILPLVREVFGESLHQQTSEPINTDEPESVNESGYGEIYVFLQIFKGIPIQVKLCAGDDEKRFGLPEQFTKAAMKVEPTSSNYVMERKWEDQGIRYGDMSAVGDQIVQELTATYDTERLEQLIAQAFAKKEGKTISKQQLSVREISLELNNPDWEKRYAALEQMNPTQEHLLVLQQALQDSKISIRRLAVAYLGMIEDSSVLPYLYQALKDKSAVVRRTAGDALSDLGNPEAIPVMIEALKDQNKLVRWRAARYLYEVGNETATPALCQAEGDPEFEVSLQVKLALERIEKGEKAEGTVWQQMTKNRN